MASTCGKTAGLTKAIGTRIICMEKASTSGLMVGSTTETTRMTKKKDMASTPTLTVVSIEECGRMVSNMEKESLKVQMESKGRASGGTGRESDGSTTSTQSIERMTITTEIDLD